MKIKKYIAGTMPEAMKQIRADLGSDAIILNSKEIKHGGIFGIFKKKKIEVIAALDKQPIKETSNLEVDVQPVAPIVQKDDANSEVLNEIKYLKKILEQQGVQSEAIYLPDYQLAYQHLIDQEVESIYAKEIMDTVVKNNEADEDMPSQEIIIQDVRLEIKKRLTEIKQEEVTSLYKVLHFVGPTGVGKTTTLAKIAANKMLNEKQKVAFITMDTYRIAAIEQLKTYARILDVPIEVAYSIEDYKNAVQKFESYDLILVDTAGRNFRDAKYVNELLGNMDQEIKTYVVLSLTAKPKDIIEIYDQFNHIEKKEVIFTKIDETRQYGSILNIALANQIRVAYITDGQDVPDDLIEPSPEVISNYIVRGYLDE